MVLAQEIEVDIDRMRDSADRHFATLRRRLHETASNPYAIRRLRVEVEQLKKEHRRAAVQHRSLLEAINRKISTFNQTVPIASLHRIPLSISHEIDKFEDRVPAYLNYEL